MNKPRAEFEELCIGYESGSAFEHAASPVFMPAHVRKHVGPLYAIIKPIQFHKSLLRRLISRLTLDLWFRRKILRDIRGAYWLVEKRSRLDEGDFFLFIFRSRLGPIPFMAAEVQVRQTTAAYWVKAFQNSAPHLSIRTPGYTNTPHGYLSAPAMNINIRHDLRPYLNVLLPRVAMASVSGGTNTVFNISFRLAVQGIPVRYISHNEPGDTDHGPLMKHLEKLTGMAMSNTDIQFIDACDWKKPFEIGNRDIFLASAWWNVEALRYVLPQMKNQRFIYLIQEYEPGLHAHSMHFVTALNTYSMDYLPVVNHPFVYDYFCQHGIGRFAESEFQRQALVFNPAVDRQRFFPVRESRSERKRLLFYARPNIATRNLFELGVAALQLAAMRGAFDHDNWEITGIGDEFSPISLTEKLTLRSVNQYAVDWGEEMRNSDILLSLIASPHTSYPPLEMAACGGLVVTNTFACKTAEKLREVSKNFIPAEPTTEAIAEALYAATGKLAQYGQEDRKDTLNAPETWNESFTKVTPRLAEFWYKHTGPEIENV